MNGICLAAVFLFLPGWILAGSEVPSISPLEALEMSRSRNSYPEGVWREGPQTLPLIASSDAHRPEEVGSGRTIFLMAEAALDEIRLAFRNQEGRRLVKFIHNALDP